MRTLQVSGLAAIFAAALLCAPATALAASCCGGASATDAFVMPKYNHWLFGATYQAQHDFARRDKNGDYQSSSYGNTENKLTLGGTWRPYKDIQATLSVPLTVRTVAVPGQRATGFYLGDIGLQARYEILDEETCFLIPVQKLNWHDMKPTVHWVLKGSLPSGRSAARSNAPLGEDVTSQGYWLVDTGIEITKIWGRWGNSMGALVGYQTPEPVSAHLRKALRIGLDGSLMLFFAYKQSVGLSVSHRRQHWTGAGSHKQVTTNGSLFTSLIFSNGWLLRANTGPTGWLQGINNFVGWQGAVTVGHLW